MSTIIWTNSEFLSNSVIIVEIVIKLNMQFVVLIMHYANEPMLIAENANDLDGLIVKVKEHSEKIGQLNKT